MLINLTPHIVKIITPSNVQEIPPTTPAARVASRLEEREAIDGVPFSATVFGTAENVPDPAPGVWYIVSALVIAACPERADLVRPDTGADAIRENGQIVAVRRLTR